MGAATEFDKLRKRRRIKKAFKRTTWLMILALLVACGFLAWSVGYYLDVGSRAVNYFSSMKPGPGYPVSLDDMHVYELIPMGQDVAVVTRSGNYIYNQNGARLYTCLNSYSNPITRGSGGKLLTYDSVGREVKITTKSELLFTLQREGKVFAADICSSGAFAIAESSRGSLGLVTAYSAAGDEMYRWETSQGYLYGLSLNNRGTMFAAATVNSNGGDLSSKIHFHHFSAAEEAGVAHLADEIVLSMVWTGENRLQVITDRNLHVYNQDGIELFVVPVPEEVSAFENSPEGCVYLVSGDYRSPEGATVTGYDSTLRLLGSWQSNRKVFGLDYFQGRLLILTEGRLYLADRTLSQVKEREQGSDLTAVCGVGNVIYGINADGLVRQGL